MSIDSALGDAVEAVNKVTTVVETKMTSINNTLAAALANFDLWRSEKDVIGLKNIHGSVRNAIFQGVVYETDEKISQPFGSGGFTGKVPALNTRGQVYLHFKTPMNVNNDSNMYHFSIQGYSYGNATVINEIIVGYCFKDSKSIINKSSFGSLSPDSYADGSGNVILRVLIPNSYYTTIKIDTMYVGNGRLFDTGDLDVKLSLASTVEF